MPQHNGRLKNIKIKLLDEQYDMGKYYIIKKIRYNEYRTQYYDISNEILKFVNYDLRIDKVTTEYGIFREKPYVIFDMIDLKASKSTLNLYIFFRTKEEMAKWKLKL